MMSYHQRQNLTYAINIFMIVATFLFFAFCMFAVGRMTFKPDIVAYECPREQLGYRLAESTYDGKMVHCSYITASETFGRARKTVPAIEHRE
jgi:hypothetical protein